jgi:hypothetical protein
LHEKASFTVGESLGYETGELIQQHIFGMIEKADVIAVTEGRHSLPFFVGGLIGGSKQLSGKFERPHCEHFENEQAATNHAISPKNSAPGKPEISTRYFGYWKEFVGSPACYCLRK